MVSPATDSVSDLDGEEAGGFVVVNVDASFISPCQILEEDGGAYFPTLREARAACRRWRNESGNDMIFVYALVGVRDAIAALPDQYPLQ